MEGLYNLFHSVSDFIETFSIMKSSSEIHVTYIYKIYDLVDKDLDYDEEYYKKFIDNLLTLVITELQELRIKAVISVGKKVMTQNNICEKEITITQTEIIYKYFK